MDIKEIRGKDSRELRLDIQTLEKEGFQLMFRSAAGDVTNPARHKQIRRTIARIKTVLRQRQEESKQS